MGGKAAVREDRYRARCAEKRRFLGGGGRGEVAALQNWEVLNPCSAEVSPRASVSLSRLAFLSRTVMVMLSDDFYRGERLLFLKINFEPDSGCIEQLDFLIPVGFRESY